MKKITVTMAALFFGVVLAGAGCKKKDEQKAAPTGDMKPTEGDKKPEETKPPEGDKPTETPPATAGSTGLTECDAYVTAMDAYLKCDKVPQQARDGAKQGLDAMKAAWGDTANMPDDAKKQANDACKQAVDALKQGATAMGCTI